MPNREFSHRSRETALRRFAEEEFDLLVIGGGITGAAVARDAVSRGLKVALVEKHDFAFGTSSRSSKLIHGGLRYLQNFELGLVFEALSERALLLKTMPHMVRPLPFYLPVYDGDKHGRGILGAGLWLYDLLSLFGAPHKSLSKKKLLEHIPFLKADGLRGGFRYYDASMWDDVLAVETLRAAQAAGAVVASYVEAVQPIWADDRVTGFQVRDREKPVGQGDISLRAKRVVVCAGPWADVVGAKLSPNWHRWIIPSKGVHLIFDLKRIPLPGVAVMSNSEDGRIAFVIPRPDMGNGVVIVGTTDGPTPLEPEKAEVEPADVDYLMRMLRRYFPTLNLQTSDILSAYVGVRPLMGASATVAGSEGQDRAQATAAALQKVSREHHIDHGPGGTVVVAGGKYTTHRRMAAEIVEFALRAWRRDAKLGKAAELPKGLRKPSTRMPVNPRATFQALAEAKARAAAEGLDIPDALYERFGAEALEVAELARESASREAGPADPEGFPFLAAQLRYCMRTGMVMHLEDFYLRRVPLHASRMDHGLPWAEKLARVWAEERGASESEMKRELDQLKAEIERRSAWKARVQA